jgi:hypothetical protein
VILHPLVTPINANLGFFRVVVVNLFFFFLSTSILLAIRLDVSYLCRSKMAEIKIESKLFQERVSHFATAWKNDIRLKEGVFNGVSSILIMMGKVEEVPEFHKNNAVHVSYSLRIPSSHIDASDCLNFSNSFGFLATSSQPL